MEAPVDIAATAMSTTTSEARVTRETRGDLRDIPKGARFCTVSSNTYHTRYHEGFSRAPDGRRLLVLERHRARPWVVNVAAARAASGG